MSDTLLKDADSTELCEALARCLEIDGEEVLEKNFQRFIDRGGGEMIIKTECTVWVILGDGADSFRSCVKAWLRENGYNESGDS